MLVACLSVGCGSSSGDGESSTFTGGESDGSAESAESDEGETSTDEGSTGDEGPLFDLGMPDLPNDSDPIPQTCDAAAQAETTVGCLFYAVDLDQNGTGSQELYTFGVGVSNVQEDEPALVTVEVKQNGNWVEAASPQLVDPLDLFVFELDDLHQHESGVLEGGAYRISSDVPIIAYQFNPLVSGYTSDASLLYPVSALDTLHQVVGWGGNGQYGYVTIAATADDTQVELWPSVPTLAGPGVSAGFPGNKITIALNEGDVAEVAATEPVVQLTGTRIESNEDHPIAVFTGHPCAHVPETEPKVIACDHIEEQLAGLRLWGTRFVASRMPVRDKEGWEGVVTPETTLWQVYASEDDTEITIEADAEVTGLPDTPVVLQQGEKLEFYAGGTHASPGDFFVEATRPIAVLNYMTGRGALTNLVTSHGDPAMVQLAPVEQFLPRYVMYVPGEWDSDQAVITRAAGATVTIDGVEVSDAEFSPVGPDHEVARVDVADGVHLFESDAGLGVVIVGFEVADSYAYLGGAGTARINPNPEG